MSDEQKKATPYAGVSATWCRGYCTLFLQGRTYPNLQCPFQIKPGNACYYRKRCACRGDDAGPYCSERCAHTQCMHCLSSSCKDCITERCRHCGHEQRLEARQATSKKKKGTLPPKKEVHGRPRSDSTPSPTAKRAKPMCSV